MKTVHILQCMFITVLMMLSTQASARDRVECSISIDYLNHTEISKSRNNSQQDALVDAIQKGCLNICSSQDIKSDCPQKCLKDAAFNKAECHRHDSKSLGLKGVHSDNDEPPAPNPVDTPESYPVDKADINKAIHKLTTSNSNSDNSPKSAQIVQQEAPLLFTKWVGNSDKRIKKHPLILDTSKKKKKLLLSPPKKKASLLLK